jgi:hypothetical protein
MDDSEACWIYEQMRLAMSCTFLELWMNLFLGALHSPLNFVLITVTTLQQECTRAPCPEMKAGEWLYLCGAHGNDGAMEVFFVHITTSTVNLTSCFSLGKHCCAIHYIFYIPSTARLPC